MKRGFVISFLFIALLSWGNAEAKTNEFSQKYVCDGFALGQAVSVYEMKQPVVGYLGSIDRWVTFERGQVALDYDVRYYFTWNGLEWTFNYLPFVGDIIEMPYEYELWSKTYISDLGMSIVGAFNQGYLAPNCWSEETVGMSHSGGEEVTSKTFRSLPVGSVGDF